MIVMNKVQTLLFPMDLKKYMILTFGTLWTLILIIALTVTLIHQINFQDSSDKIHLEEKVKGLQEDLNTSYRDISNLKRTIIDTKTTYKVSIKNHKELIAKQNLEIAKGVDTIKGLRDFYSYIIKPEALYYKDILND